MLTLPAFAYIILEYSRIVKTNFVRMVRNVPFGRALDLTT